jgi:hypothetical protein
MSEQPKCELCGEPMPAGEEMFKYHGHSGPCPTKGKAFEPWQLRVIEEKKELDARLVKLSELLSGKAFAVMAEDDQELLLSQKNHMSCYSGILGERIARLEQN